MILLFPYPRPLRNGKISAKNYPYWEELISYLQKENYSLIQLGVEGEKQLVPDFRKNMSINKIENLIKECHFWISCDSFAQHLAAPLGKRGVVLWGTSHPIIFGYPFNCNILKDKKYLRTDPYYWWEDEPLNPETYVNAEEVYKIIEKEFLNKK